MKIHELKNSQYISVEWPGYEKGKLKIWMHPYLNKDGIWEVEATCSGDYIYYLTEEDEPYISEATFRD